MRCHVWTFLRSKTKEYFVQENLVKKFVKTKKNKEKLVKIDEIIYHDFLFAHGCFQEFLELRSVILVHFFPSHIPPLTGSDL